MIVAICQKCKKEFACYPSDGRKACSKKCVIYAKKHGMSKTRLYSIWRHMKTRCENPKSSAFKYYGQRGISVCDEWKSFETFRDWSIANGYSDDLEIDRKDGDLGYFPDNCRWATRSVQMGNTRKRSSAKTSKYKGVSWCENAGKWRVQIGHNGSMLHVGLFEDEIEAAKAYDSVAAEKRGEYTRLNFKEGKPS